MSLEVARILAAVLSIGFLPGLATALLVRRSDDSPYSYERVVGHTLVFSLAYLTMAALVLDRYDAITPSGVWRWTVASLTFATGALAYVWKRRGGKGAKLTRRELFLLTAWSTAVLALTIPHALLVVARPESLISPTPWYYWHLSALVAENGSAPLTLYEWGTNVLYLDDYPAFTRTAALSIVAGGGTGTLAAAQLVRLATLATTVAGFTILARVWGATRTVALGASSLLIASVVITTKLASFRPEAAGYGLMFLIPAFGLEYLKERRHIDLIACSTATATLSLLHGIAWTAGVLLLAATALVHLMSRENIRGRIRSASLLAVGTAVPWVAISYLATQRVSNLGKLATAPSFSTTGADPTWQFAAFSTASEGLPPPTTWELLEASLSRGYHGTPVLIGVVLGVAIVGVALALQDKEKEALLALSRVLVGVGLAILLVAVFSITWDTYVPRRTGASRIAQLWVVLPPLAAAGVIGSIRKSRGLEFAFATSALVLLLSASGSILDLSGNQPPESMLAVQGSTRIPSESVVLANAYTEGFIPVMIGGRGLLDGRAPYTEAALLERANSLLVEARSFFADPIGNRKYLEGIDYVVVTTGPWQLGTPRIFPADLRALDEMEELDLIVDNGYRVYRINR